MNVFDGVPINHEQRMRYITEKKRFKVVSAGRRSGKTWDGKKLIKLESFRDPGLYGLCAPTQDQAKYIFWQDLKDSIPKNFWSKQPNETSKELWLKNGSIFRVVGLDKAQRIEGQPWKMLLIDETDDLKDGVWQTNIRPALDTLGLETCVILCGVPNGKKLLFDLSKKAITDPDDWGFYHWFSSMVLPPEVIAQAKADLSPLEFRQEYEASFETAEGLVYPDYDSDKNSTTRQVDPGWPIIWTHDFNFTPRSSAIIQEIETVPHVLDEIVLSSAVALNSAKEFVERYKDHQRKLVYLFGDYSGTAGEKHHQSSDYLVMEQYLRQNGWIVNRQVKPNPAIKDGQNALRALICNANGDRRFFVNVAKCRYVDNGLGRTSLKLGSTFQEDESDFQHITTALRYYAYTRHNITNQGIRQGRA